MHLFDCCFRFQNVLKFHSKKLNKTKQKKRLGRLLSDRFLDYLALAVWFTDQSPVKHVGFQEECVIRNVFSGALSTACQSRSV